MDSYWKNFLLILVFFTYGCSLSKEEIYSNQVIASFAKKQQEQNRLVVFGTGGSMPNKVKSLFVSFTSYDILSFEDVRCLYVNLVEDFINEILEDGRLESYAETWPFTEVNAEIGLGFEQPDGTLPEFPQVGYVCLDRRREISYAIWDGETQRLKEYFREPYEVALKSVKGGNYKRKWKEGSEK